jgi:nitroreductase
LIAATAIFGGDDMTEHAISDSAPNNADLFEIMRTTRSMWRLKPDPVPNALIRKILEAGVCAPSGGNMQRWRFLVIRDPKIKQTVGAYHKRAWDEQVATRIALVNRPCSRWNSRATARDRCSLAEATLKQVISGMQQASAARTIRSIIRLTA